MTRSSFLERHYQRAPHAMPARASPIVPTLSWSTLPGLLARATDLMIVARGQRFDRPAPRSLADVHALFHEGLGFVVRGAGALAPGLAEVGAALARDLPGSVDVHAFATPGGTHGFSWHYDVEEVFIVQTAGRKDYYFRRNTCISDLSPDSAPALERYPRERSPIAAATLEPGDWLYLPAGWWHMALCQEDSLSLSIGLTPGGRSARVRHQ